MDSDTVWEIVNVNDEKNWTSDGPMGYPTHDFSPFGNSPGYTYSLLLVVQEPCDP